MTPYLAIIKDSFREALASRVLWIMLLLITLLLLGLAPLGWDGAVGSSMFEFDIRNINNFAPELQKGKEADATPIQKKIWDSLSDDTRKKFEELKDGERGPVRVQARALLTNDLNRLIDQEDFYDPELWDGIEIPPRLEELLTRSDLSLEFKKQRNRLALEAALPGQIRPCPEEAMKFSYGTWSMDFIPPLKRSIATEQIEFIILVVVKLFVGFFGIFAAVLVTAPIIPNMLSTGSLFLLLSKPIARPLLFLAKFCGGCSFVLISVAYLVVGIWVILGLRFEIWKPQLLWAIPIFLFTFAIFYAVSAVSGLISRNTIVAISMTILFWAFCRSIGVVHGLMEQLIVVPDRIERIVPTDDQIFVQRGNSGFGRWNESENVISPIMETLDPDADMMMGPRTTLLGMVYDEKNEVLISLELNWSQANIISALKANEFRREPPAPSPKNSVALFMRKGKPTVVADGGVYQVSLAQVEEPLSDINIFGLRIPAPAAKDENEKISEGLGSVTSETRVAFSSEDDRIYIYQAQALQSLLAEGGIFSPTNKSEVALKQVSHIAAGKGVVVLASRKEDVSSLQVFDGETLAEKTTLSLASDADVRQLAISENGNWVSLLTDDDKLTVFDLSQDGEARSVRGNWSAATIYKDKLLLSNQNDRIVTRTLSDMKTESTINPKLSMFKRAFRFFVSPAYLVCPKPAELQNTMQYALTGKDTQRVEGPGMGPGGRTIKLKPWQPIYSNSAFIVAMLSFGCLYVYRQDF